MPDDGDAPDQEAMGVQDLVQQTGDQAGQVPQLSQEIAAAAGEVRRQGTSARERAAAVKRRELAAHQRAIELQEQAAQLQERLGIRIGRPMPASTPNMPGSCSPRVVPSRPSRSDSRRPAWPRRSVGIGYVAVRRRLVELAVGDDDWEPGWVGRPAG
jgi:hypothetical protein